MTHSIIALLDAATGTLYIRSVLHSVDDGIDDVHHAVETLCTILNVSSNNVQWQVITRLNIETRV